MTSVCNPMKCVGCKACLNICPKSCITILHTNDGGQYAKIEETNCVHCNLCKKTCPVINDNLFLYPKVCYAAKRKDILQNQRCASGGIVSLLLECCIKKGWKVFATKMDEHLDTFVTEVLLNEVNQFQGSLYVFSDTKFVFNEIKKYVQQGFKVLFVGLPCQVGGLLLFLNGYNCSNLFTIDLVCHGTSPIEYLKDETYFLEKKEKIKEVTQITFRGQKEKEDFYFILWDKAKKMLSQKGRIENYYFRGFLTGTSLRGNCYSCKFAKKERVGDLTCGDFIGIKSSLHGGMKDNDLTMVAINSDKGKILFSIIEEECFFENRDYKEAVNHCISLQTPFPKSKTREIFLREMKKNNNFSLAIRKSLFWSMKKEWLLVAFQHLFRKKS